MSMESTKANGFSRLPAAGKLLPALVVACLLAGALLIPSSNLFGQATVNASLSGSVLDSSGAVVPEATVTLTDSSRNFSRTFTTLQDGTYSFTFLPSSTYTLRVEKSGFRTYVQQGIVLVLGQAAAQDISLQLGAQQQEISVTAEAPILNTSNANIGSDVTQKQAVELPLNWRNVFSLVLVDSSVNNSANRVSGAYGEITEQGSAFFNFGGGRTGSTAFLLDGHWNVATDWGGTMYAPGVDELQELKIQTHAFTAEYGWTMGNILNAVTKGGTESFHGGAFEFLRNDNMDANLFFNNKSGLSKPEFKRNNFGVYGGGPLYIPKIYEQKDKTFVFGYYEGLRMSNPYSTGDLTLPTVKMKNGDFTEFLGAQTGSTDALGRPTYAGAIYDPFSTRQITSGQVDPVTNLPATATGYIRDPFGATAANGWTPSNMIPSGMLDSVASNLLQFWPDPIRPGINNNFASTGNLPGYTDRYSVRVDQNISDNSRFFARWSQERIFVQGSADYFGKGNPGGPGSGNPNPRWDAAANFTHSFSPTLVLSVTGGDNYWSEGFRPTGYPFNPSTLGFPAYVDQAPNFPGIGIEGVFGLGAGYWSATPRENRTLLVDITKVRGGHTIKTGFQHIWLLNYETFVDPGGYNFDRGMTLGPDPTTAAPGTGVGFASFLLGTGASSFGTGSAAAGGFPLSAQPSLEKKYIGWYFQDDWRVNRKLTLNLGIRWDMQTAATERFDRISWFDPTDPHPLSQVVTPSYVDPYGQTQTFDIPGHFNYVGGPNRRGVNIPEYNNIAPRLGVAYKITDKLVFRGGFGMFYTASMEVASYMGLDMYGFSATTPWVASVDGITPKDLLSNPFPNGFIQPVGKPDGIDQPTGQSTRFFLPTDPRPTPLVYEWTAGFQYQLAQNDSITALYVGNHGRDMAWRDLFPSQLSSAQLANGNDLLTPVSNPFFGHITSSGCGLDQPTVPWFQLLRTYPQYCTVLDRQSNSSKTYYDAVKFDYQHRWSGGLQMLASFTISKYIDYTSGRESWVTGGGGNYVPQDYHNLAAEKSLDFNDIPKSLVVSFIYQLPFGHGQKFGNSMNKFADAVLGGWQVSGISTFKDGFPLTIANSFDNSGSRGGQQRPNCVGNPSISDPSVEQWINTAAFVQPAEYTFGNCPRTLPHTRAMGINNWDTNLQKWFRQGERVKVQFRAEFYNMFNRTYLYKPNMYYSTAPGNTFGQVVDGTGPSRSIQLGLKIYW